MQCIVAKIPHRSYYATGKHIVKKLTVKKLTTPGPVKILTMTVIRTKRERRNRTKQEQKNSQVVGFFIWLPLTITEVQLTFF